MAEQAAEREARYRFGPLERRGLIAGWRGGQIATVAAGLVIAIVVLHRRATPWNVALALCAVLGGITLALCPSGAARSSSGPRRSPGSARNGPVARVDCRERRPGAFVQTAVPGRSGKGGPGSTTLGPGSARSARHLRCRPTQRGGPRAGRLVRRRHRRHGQDDHGRPGHSRPELLVARCGRQAATCVGVGRGARRAGPGGLARAPAAVAGPVAPRRRRHPPGNSSPSVPGSTNTPLLAVRTPRSSPQWARRRRATKSCSRSASVPTEPARGPAGRRRGIERHYRSVAPGDRHAATAAGRGGHHRRCRARRDGAGECHAARVRGGTQLGGGAGPARADVAMAHGPRVGLVVVARR